MKDIMHSPRGSRSQWIVSFPRRPSPFLNGTMTCAKLLRGVYEPSMGNRFESMRKFLTLWKTRRC